MTKIPYKSYCILWVADGKCGTQFHKKSKAACVSEARRLNEKYKGVVVHHVIRRGEEE